jgi:hypothetical protein
MKLLKDGEALSLAKEACSSCNGSGFLEPQHQVCACVWRAIFRICYGRFRYYHQHFVSARASLDSCFGTHRASVYGASASEFCSDFELIARRTLPAPKFAVFNLHFLLGANWRLCTEKLKTDRSSFFHDIYRIEEKLGRAFFHCAPHSLYPLADYFTYNPSLMRRPTAMRA